MKLQRILGFSLATIMLGAAGCSVDRFLDVNTDPNNPLVATPSNLLPSTIIETGFANGNEINRITSLLIQHVAGIANQSPGQDVYNIRGGLDNQWQGELYSGALKGTQKTIEAANRLNSPAYAGIAKLLKAYNFAMTTDLWGDVPYSESLQFLEKLQPRFDKQEDIYKGNSALKIQGLFELVKEGIADLDKPSTFNPSAADDPVYGGANPTNATPAVTAAHLAKWKKMGNTLLLKLANTISRKEPALAKAMIDAVVAQGATAYISANAEDFEVPFGSAGNSQNPIYNFNYVQRNTDMMLSQRLLDSMSVKKDPRLPFFFTATPTPTTTVNITGTVTSVGVFTGFQNGSGAAVPVIGNRSRYGSYVIGTSGNAPIRLLTNFQRLFIMAESALILGTSTGSTGATVQSLYQDAIRASMVKAGVTDAAVTAYFTANPSVAILSGSNERKLNQIITQKWIAWVGNGYEAFNDYRRTGFPRLALVTNPQGDNGTLPRRFVYPVSETSGNANNAPSPLPGTTVPVWWDVR